MNRVTRESERERKRETKTKSRTLDAWKTSSNLSLQLSQLKVANLINLGKNMVTYFDLATGAFT